MYRITTPTFTFKIPYEFSEIDKILITFAQNGSIRVEKTKEDCLLDAEKKTIQLTLNMSETAKFSFKNQGQIQMRIRLLSGRVYSSDVKTFDVHRVFNETETLTPIDL